MVCVLGGHCHDFDQGIDGAAPLGGENSPEAAFGLSEISPLRLPSAYLTMAQPIIVLRGPFQ